ncbi:hypothetical protein D9757_008493 [Collybiopsis confluens]|uniref:Uncharacterized protein n=1 Tax=Collybiopsis confluens TaxID=2823264 RepID=A0A8H5HEX2_9AGAR|nr:hypothetical protein D9757_008493 [Collybiopsis confluens]
MDRFNLRHRTSSAKRTASSSQSTADIQQLSTQPSSLVGPEASAHTLRTFAASAQASSVPFLQVLSSLALRILDTTSNTPSNEHQDPLRELASATCNIALAVLTIYEGLLHLEEQQERSPDPLSPDPDSVVRAHGTSILDEEVQSLIVTFKAIEEFIHHPPSARPLLRRIVSPKSDSSIIHDYKDQLQSALDAFKSKSDIILCEMVSKIAAQQKLMNQKISDIRRLIYSSSSGEARGKVAQNETPKPSDEQLPASETPKRHIPPLMEDTVPNPTGPVKHPPNLNRSRSKNPFAQSFDTASPWPAPSASPSPTPTQSQSQRPEDDSSSRKSQSGTSGIHFEETFLNGAASCNIRNFTVNHTVGDSVVITRVDHSYRENFGNVYNGMGERRDFASRQAASADRSGRRTGREDDLRCFRRGGGADMKNVPYGSRDNFSRPRTSINDGEERPWSNRPGMRGWRSYDTGDSFNRNDEEAGSYEYSRNDAAYCQLVPRPPYDTSDSLER